MDRERLVRYTEKLDHAEDRIERFRRWSKDAATEDKARFACYKVFQEAVESIMDVVAMLVKDLDRLPKDDYANLEILAEEEILGPDLVADLAEANGLRNRLVHEYNGLDDEMALRSGGRLVPKLQESIGVIRTWLSETS